MTEQHPWPQAPVPAATGDVWHWQLASVEANTRARADLRSRLGHPAAVGAGTDEARESLLLAFEELTSNARIHGRGHVRAAVVGSRPGWVLDVSDEAPDDPPRPAVGRDPSHGGMGLQLVAELAIEYGWERRLGRKHVWAILPSGIGPAGAIDASPPAAGFPQVPGPN